MQDGPIKVKKSRYNRNPVPFKLRAALENETQFLVSTTLPSAEHINTLWELVSDIRDEIAWCLNMVYSHITMRGAHGEGKEHFFHHVAGTALYESHQKKLIKGKNHGLKAGAIVQKLIKTIEKIKQELDSTSVQLEHREILENFKAELIAHYNTLVLAVTNLPQKDQEHLKKHQNLDPQSLMPIKITPEDEIRIIKLHPEPEQQTPKKLSKAAHASKEALQTTEPPLEIQQKHVDAIFAQLIRGTSLEAPKEKPAAFKKLNFSDQVVMDEIDVIFASLEKRPKSLNFQFNLALSSSSLADVGDTSISIDSHRKADSRSSKL